MADTLVQIIQSKLGSRFKDVRGDMPNGRGMYANADSRKMKYIVLHHSAGQPGASAVAAIARFHASPPPIGRGWPGIGYHFVVAGGVVYYVGSVDTQRAHIANRNAQGLGVCIPGTYNKNLPAAPDIEATRLLVAGLDEFYGHKKVLAGHAPLMPPGHTACPGRVVEIIPALRPAAPAPAPKPAPAVVKLDKVRWALEESARLLQREGLVAEHDYIVNKVLPGIGKEDA